MESNIDLFEKYEEQPKELQIICNYWHEIQASKGLNYKECHEFKNQVEAIGYSFSYGLDSEPFYLHKIRKFYIDFLDPTNKDTKTRKFFDSKEQALVWMKKTFKKWRTEMICQTNLKPKT